MITLLHFMHTYPVLEAFLIQIFCKFTRLNCITKWRLKNEFTCTKNQGNWQFINRDYIWVRVFLISLSIQTCMYQCRSWLKSWFKNEFTYMYIKEYRKLTIDKPWLNIRVFVCFYLSLFYISLLKLLLHQTCLCVLELFYAFSEWTDTHRQ